MHAIHTDRLFKNFGIYCGTGVPLSSPLPAVVPFQAGLAGRGRVIPILFAACSTSGNRSINVPSIYSPPPGRPDETKRKRANNYYEGPSPSSLPSERKKERVSRRTNQQLRLGDLPSRFPLFSPSLPFSMSHAAIDGVGRVARGKKYGDDHGPRPHIALRMCF